MNGLTSLRAQVHRGFNCVLSFGSDSGKATFSNLLQSLRVRVRACRVACRVSCVVSRVVR
jgi:hypothetical protein